MRRMLRLLAALLCALLLCVGGACAFEAAIAQAEISFPADGDLPAGCGESVLGDLLADAMTAATGADFALLPSGDFTGTLGAGAVFDSDLERIIPDDETLCTVRITPTELKALLEVSFSHLTVDESEAIDPDVSAWAGFVQIAGFSLEADASAPSGERITRLIIDGRALDPADDETEFTLVTTADLLDGSLGYPTLKAQPLEFSLRDAAHLSFAASDTLTRPDSRLTVIGTSSFPLMDRFPVFAIVIACALIAFLAAIPQVKERRFFSFSGK